MAQVLAISSWVAVGHVGLSAATPALQALGSTVVGLPTVMLSSHKGFRPVAAAVTPAPALAEMLAAIRANGWLRQIDAVLTGYLPTTAHVALAAQAIAAARDANPVARVVVDPVLGDDPGGLYLPQDVACALRDRLVPLVDILTPNRFELAWLASAPAADAGQAAQAARALLRGMGPTAQVVVTSPPFGDGQTGALAVRAQDPQPRVWRTPRLAQAPHGVGDVFSALLAGGVPVGAATGMLAALTQAAWSGSAAAAHLPIVSQAARWTAAAPVRGATLQAGAGRPSWTRPGP